MRQRAFAIRESGGVILWIVVAIALGAAAYYGYRGLLFYRQHVAPAVAEVSKVAGALAKYVPSYQLTRDPDQIARILDGALRIAPPDDYEGAFGFSFDWMGRNRSQLVALAPKGVPASDIFEGGKGEIRFRPGRHTIFIAVRSDDTDREDMRDGIVKMVNGDAQMEALQPVFIDAGGRRVAAYVGTAESYGERNRLVFVFLDDGRLLHAVGPAGAFNDGALTRVLAALVATHPANEFLYAHANEDAIARPANDPCGIAGLPDDFDVVMLSVMRGSKPLDIAIDQSGYEVAREEVVVGSTPKPVVLVLNGYDPIVWNVGQAPGARIAGVLAVGVYRQAVTGLPKTTRMTAYSSSDGPNACRYFRPESGEANALKPVDRRIRELFGRKIGTFRNVKGGERFVVGDVSGDVVHSPNVTLAQVALPADVLPGGQRGIDRLVKEQALRVATDAEVAAWIAGASQRTGQPADDYRRRVPGVRNDRVYVLARDVALPAALYGANSHTFIVPPGVPVPAPEARGHNTFLLVDGFKCTGTGCP